MLSCTSTGRIVAPHLKLFQVVISVRKVMDQHFIAISGTMPASAELVSRRSKEVHRDRTRSN